MPPDPRLLEFARSMRREPTPTERQLWRMLRGRQLAGFKLRRQHPLGLYVLDFYARDAALVVELDGDSHCTDEGREHDRVRTAYLESLGLRVLRFWNTDVHENSDAVLELIAATCAARQGRVRHRTPDEHRQPRRSRTTAEEITT